MNFRALEAYKRKVGKILSSSEREELMRSLGVNPTAGVLIRGSGGMRKLRWAASGRGKSGGARIIYYYVSSAGVIYFCDIYKKKDQANLTPKQIRNIKRELP